jgi:hypothetical protein
LLGQLANVVQGVERSALDDIWDIRHAGRRSFMGVQMMCSRLITWVEDLPRPTGLSTDAITQRGRL